MTDTITESEWLHRQIGALTAGLSTLAARVERLEAAAKPAPTSIIDDLAAAALLAKLPTTPLPTHPVASLGWRQAFLGEDEG